MAGSSGVNGVSHLASVLPFRVLEDLADKPLRITGVALAVGMSRNFNVYTSEELQAFAQRLVNVPVYLEHVTASETFGVAEKTRNGLIQHVNVGADYQTIDVVDTNVHHERYNTELSSVAVPGITHLTGAVNGWFVGKKA